MSKHSPIDDVEAVGEKVSAFSRAVAAKRGAALAVVATLGTVAAELGLHDKAGIGQYATTWIERIVWVASALGGITWIHQGVTPADPAKGPVASDGQPLIRASVAALALKAVTTDSTPSPSEHLLSALDADAAALLDEAESGETPTSG